MDSRISSQSGSLPVSLHKKDDSSWSQYSQIIAQKMLSKMEEQGLNQKNLLKK